MDKYPVLKIQRFSTKDGPSVRTTVFLKGCPLSCKWCHNPESQSNKPNLFYYEKECVLCGKCVNVCKNNAVTITGEKRILNRDKCVLCGKCVNECLYNAIELDYALLSSSEILAEVLKDVAFYGEKGGVTLSGGEPLYHGEKALLLLELFKNNGLNTVVETSGYFNKNLVERLVKCVDLFLFDIKDTNSENHAKYTGVTNEVILNNLYAIDSLGGKTVLKCILISGVNLTETHLSNIAKIYHQLKNVKSVEIFACRTHGEGKYLALGKNCEINSSYTPTDTQMRSALKFLKENGVKSKITN